MIYQPDKNIKPTLASHLQNFLRFASGIPLALCLLTTVALTTIFLAYSRGVLERAEDEGRAVAEEVSEVLRREDQTKKQARHEVMIKRLFVQAKTEGLLRREWNERRVNVQSVTMQRDQLNELMADVSNSPHQIFGAEQFDIAVKNVNYGLFDEPTATDDGVVVTLRGAAYFRAAQVQE